MRQTAVLSLNPGEFLALTGHLSTEERGACFLLLLHRASTRDLPTDRTELAQIARMSPGTWEASQNHILPLCEKATAARFSGRGVVRA